MVRSVFNGVQCSPVHDHQNRPNVRTSLKAFTLVELLVVIGIIALLISILLPTLGRVRDQAVTTKCLANMTQIGTAFTMYVNDNKGNMPYAEPDMAWKPWAAQFYGTGTPSQPYHFNNVHRHLMKYLNGRIRSGQTEVTLSSQIFRCPNAEDFPTSANRPFELSNTNYTFNGVMIRRKVTSVRKSSSFIIASESRYAWNASAMRPYPAVGAGIATANLDTLEYRQWMWVESGATAGQNKLLNLTLHRKQSSGNVVYLDGHAGTVDYREIRPTDFGLTDSAIAGQGLATDTYVQITADPTRSYRTTAR
jgi:prepilin-type N-terminal cleavage/methylation domain-containing protein/prepilin-type processing-associated H-X9-DG protein